VVDVLTRLDLQKLGEDVVLQRATRIDPAQVSIQGSDVNIIVGLCSQMSYALMMQLVDRTNSLLLDGAEDEQLDRWLWDRYQTTRKGAAAAVGEVRFYRSVTGSAGTIAIGTKLQTLTGIEYFTTTTANFGISDTQVFAKVRASQAGKASQVGANNIRKIVDPAALFDTSLLVNNDLATAHGEDAEDDETLRNRMRDFWSTVRRGVLSAISFGALTVPGVDSATATEVTDQGAPARLVNLYIADSSGIASSAMAQQVRDALLEYRAAGIQVLVYTSMPQIVNVTLHLTFQSGVDTDALTETIRNSLVEYINTTPVSGTLYRGSLMSVLQRYVQDGLIATEDTIVEPAGDLVPESGTTLRTTIANVVVV
jgi:uncharacterized phage protein gp47/JayE